MLGAERAYQELSDGMYYMLIHSNTLDYGVWGFNGLMTLHIPDQNVIYPHLANFPVHQ